jgi:hypothetical protein
MNYIKLFLTLTASLIVAGTAVFGIIACIVDYFNLG